MAVSVLVLGVDRHGEGGDDGGIEVCHLLGATECLGQVPYRAFVAALGQCDDGEEEEEERDNELRDPRMSGAEDG